MKICANCGNQVPDDAVFCNNCGSSLAADSAAAPAPAPEAGAAPVNQDAAASAPNTPPVMPTPQPVMQQNFQGGFQQGPNGQMPYQQPPYAQFQSVDMSDHTADFDAKDIADNKLFAALPYFFFALGIIAALLIKDSEFTKFHAKNAIRLEIATILAFIPAIIPFIGWAVTAILIVIIGVVEIIAIINVLQGKAKDLPIIGNIGFLK